MLLEQKRCHFSLKSLMLKVQSKMIVSPNVGRHHAGERERGPHHAGEREREVHIMRARACVCVCVCERVQSKMIVSANVGRHHAGVCERERTDVIKGSIYVINLSRNKRNVHTDGQCT